MNVFVVHKTARGRPRRSWKCVALIVSSFASDCMYVYNVSMSLRQHVPNFLVPYEKRNNDENNDFHSRARGWAVVQNPARASKRQMSRTDGQTN